jgi:dimethylargininase
MIKINPARFTHAICRRPGEALGAGLTTADLGAPDFELALTQHDAYVATLEKLGLKVTVLEAEPGFPDAHFVEDTAVVTPKVAIISRPGHPDRRGEEESIIPVLAAHRPVERITAEGTLDGGDVLMVGNHFFIGVSERTNTEGARQLMDILVGNGHTAETVPVAAGLHFKSSVNELGDSLLVTGEFSTRKEFADYRTLIVPDGEQYAGNTLRINDHLLTPAGYEGVHRLIAQTGLEIITLDMSEVRKMDGGLTCLSLRF